MSAGQKIEIKASVRQPGKHFSRSLRSNKLIPAVVYGPKIENLSIAISENDAVKYSKTAFENSIFTFVSDDPKVNNLQVLKKAITVHPVSRRPTHLDFYAVDLTKAVRVFVEIRFEGKALGVTEGGIFNAVRREVEVECLPTEIPEFFKIDISNLGLEEALHVADLDVPANVKMITSDTETLAIVSVPKEEAATPAAAAPGAEGAAAAPAAGAAAAAAPAAGEKKEEKK